MNKEIKIEILFPEFCNLFGDISNMKYLKKCLPEAEFIETSYNNEPKFMSEDINLIYLGPMTEKMQEKVIKKLMPLKDKIKDMIENNVQFLVTGNAIEIFGKYIENEDGTKVEALGIFDIYAKRDMLHRNNSIFIGEWENTKIVGFKSQFTYLYGNNENNYFAKVKKGIGLNPESKLEGIKEHNFIGTNVIGPILILNPEFTKYIIEKMGIKEINIAFEEDLKSAYEERLNEFENI